MHSYSQEYRLWEKLGKCVRILGSIDYGKNSENALVTPFHKLLIRPVRSLAQPCAVNNTFFSLWEGQKWVFFAKDRTYRAFLHNKLFFLIAPRDLRYY